MALRLGRRPRQAVLGLGSGLRSEPHNLLRCSLGFGFRLFGFLLCHVRPPYFLRIALCGLRLPIRLLSLPAAGSSTALISVGLPESIASLTARFNSSGDVALMPTPPKASIILSYRAPLTNTVGAGSGLTLLTSVRR